MSLTAGDPAWEKRFQARDWGRYPPEHIIRFVARNWYRHDRSQVRLLDLGSGPGSITWYMARESFSVSAIDGSPTAIELLRERLGSDGLTADARVGDMSNLPWGDQTFDGVIDNTSICCNSWEASERMLNEAYRVLKPGGRLLSATFTDRTWGASEGRPAGGRGVNQIPEGPISGSGFVRFSSRADIDELYDLFEIEAVERSSYTLENDTKLIELWLVQARRPRDRAITPHGLVP